MISNSIGRDNHKLLYEKTAQNLLQLYCLTGVLANFAGLVNINSAILVALVVASACSRTHNGSLFSPLIMLYGSLTALSLVNHIFWFPEAGLSERWRTMPIALLGMIACRSCAASGLFERCIWINSLPFLFLIPFGGHYESGRYISAYLNENMQGSLLPLAFALGLFALWGKRFNSKYMIALMSSSMSMLLGASRAAFLYLMSSVFVLSVSLIRLTLYRLAFVASLVILLVVVAIPVMTKRQQRRFGNDFMWGEHFALLIAGEANDNSSRDRLGFIELAFHAVDQNWFGYGNGNFAYVVKIYGNGSLPVAGHPHSSLAESLITAGYPGVVIYLAILLYLVKIGQRDMIMRIVLVWLCMQILLGTTLCSRLLWPMLAIAEYELQMHRIESHA